MRLRTASLDDATSGIAILGAGPAGLTAADVLARRGVRGMVFEADDQVGGLARTVERDGYRFDLGGHRFFTKIPAVQRYWEAALGDDFLIRPRLSRIYYKGQYMSYPLQAEDVVRRLGLTETVRCLCSYLWACIRRKGSPESFEDWVTDRFGRRLYRAFFQSYTEKVWGIPGSEIQALWAAQRIRNLSFWTALTSALGINRTHVTSLIEEFHYPRLGPGQLWETVAQRVEAAGVPIWLDHRCASIRHAGGRVRSVVVETPTGDIEYPVAGVLSSIALSDLVLALDPPPPEEVIAAARQLRYRDLVVVGIITSESQPFPDNWVYLHDPGVRAGRVQNFGAWSPTMVQPGSTCLGVEYFCFEGDDIWRLPEQDAIALATSELAAIGLLDPTTVTGGVKLHVRRAYPVYDRGYDDAVAVLRAYVAGLSNLETFGRNGLHRYNNQDHSMWTALLATRNLLDGEQHDVWAVNTENVYLEHGEALEDEYPSELVEAVL